MNRDTEAVALLVLRVPTEERESPREHYERASAALHGAGPLLDDRLTMRRFGSDSVSSVSSFLGLRNADSIAVELADPGPFFLHPPAQSSTSDEPSEAAETIIAGQVRLSVGKQPRRIQRVVVELRCEAELHSRSASASLNISEDVRPGLTSAAGGTVGLEPLKREVKNEIDGLLAPGDH